MRQTLRRSCAACARAKHSCDLRTPRCTRCINRKIHCVYANAPARAPASSSLEEGQLMKKPLQKLSLADSLLASLDPFDSYPQTRLPRERVQRLIHSFIHKIAFQYYPLDLNATSNPFLVSWWPLALGDPALFHVSLQTACLDEELLAQKGFQASELLMADSVTLLRRKIEDVSLAIQDGTMNSVITLAAIEFGKGNTSISNMHVDGVKKLVKMRGGINAVRETSPLTARMVSWVSMLVTGHPQFETQDDLGIGDGIPPIPEWQIDSFSLNDPDLKIMDVEYGVLNVYYRLRNVFQRAPRIPFPPTQLHDLTCFVIHRLLFSVPDTTTSPSSPMTESLRYGIVLYMFIVQGPTYFSHAVILNTIVTQLINRIAELESTPHESGSFDIWLLGVGMVASAGTAHYSWFVERARAMARSLNFGSWDEVLVNMKSILWLETVPVENKFQPHWDSLFNAADATGVLDLSHCAGPGVYEDPSLLTLQYKGQKV
ncbi:hypothetical protein BJX96DRAFT_85199 [Aspergillus floccosus]